MHDYNSFFPFSSNCRESYGILGYYLLKVSELHLCSQTTFLSLAIVLFYIA